MKSDIQQHVPEDYFVDRQYQRTGWTSYGLTLGIIIGSLWLFLPGTVEFLGAFIVDRVPLRDVLWAIVMNFPGFVFAGWVTARLHERVHKFVFDYLGYDSEIRWGVYGIPPALENPQVRPLEEAIKRNHLILVLLAPLVTVGFIAAIITFTAIHPWITFTGKLILFINTTASSGDLYDTIRYSGLDSDDLLFFTLDRGDPEPLILSRK